MTSFFRRLWPFSGTSTVPESSREPQPNSSAAWSSGLQVIDAETRQELTIPDRQKREIFEEYILEKVQQLRQSRYSQSMGITLNAEGMMDSGASDHELAQYWKHAGPQTALSIFRAEKRERSQSRCRYDFLNSPTMMGAAGSLEDQVVGIGAKLRIGSSEMERRVVERFERWCKYRLYWKKIRLAVSSLVHLGEFMIRIRPVRKQGNTANITIEVIDTIRLQTPPRFYADPMVNDGIRYDHDGNPVCYYIEKEPVNPNVVRKWNDFEVVPAHSIIYYHHPVLAGQMRGIPQMQSAVADIARERAYRYAVVDCATFAAHPVVVVSNSLPEAYVSDSLDRGDNPFMPSGATFALPRGTIMSVNNANVSQVRPEQPTQAFDGFDENQHNISGRALHMPSMVINKDSSSYNYASGQLDRLSWERHCAVLLSELDSEVNDVVLERWLDIDSQFDADSYALCLQYDGRLYEIPRKWYYEAMPHPDPVKNEQAKMIRLERRLKAKATEGMDKTPYFDTSLLTVNREDA
ncbi:MAG: phage portal protein [Planctomycetia bacterium]|nr:phage portal protein [Planctomycetia bacterium]